jgi:hypothetical protein
MIYCNSMHQLHRDKEEEELSRARRLLEGKFGVKVTVRREPIFAGYEVHFSYPYYLGKERRYKQRIYHEQAPATWEEWAADNEQDIIRSLSLF